MPEQSITVLISSSSIRFALAPISKARYSDVIPLIASSRIADISHKYTLSASESAHANSFIRPAVLEYVWGLNITVTSPPVISLTVFTVHSISVG